MMKYSLDEAIAAVTAPGQSHELYDGEVWGRPCKVFRNTPNSLRELFESARSDKTFYVYKDERYTYEETYQLSCRIARILTERYCIEIGDRVALSMRNFPEWVIIFNAITSIGGIAVAMNALWQSEEMEFGLKDCSARLLFADQERVDRMVPFWQDIDINVITVRTTNLLEGMCTLDELLEEQPPCTMPDQSPGPDDRATLMYTSGSTGHPKGAVSSHRNILTALFSWELQGRIGTYRQHGDNPPTPGKRLHQPAALLAVPLFHATGCNAVLLQSYRSQRKVVSMYRWDADEAARLIEAEHIGSLNGPATMTGDLVEAAKSSGRDLSSLNNVGGGGSARAPEQVRSIASSFGRAMPNTGWGMTETNSIGTGIGGQEYLDHPTTSGRCVAAITLRVADENGNALPTGERGELQILGASVIEGYWQRPEATLEAFDGDWLRSGDIAYVDEDGLVYIVDRIKDLVIRGGENIACAEVEAALLEHPDIIEASVYAVPDERYGEEVGTTIFSERDINHDALRTFLEDHIARFKIPRYIDVTAEPLPRIASGKINKRELRSAAPQRFLSSDTA